MSSIFLNEYCTGIHCLEVFYFQGAKKEDQDKELLATIENKGFLIKIILNF